MKRLYIAAALLVFLMAVSLTNAWYAQRLTGGMREQLVQAQLSAEQGDWDRAESVTRQAYEDWQGHHFYFHTLMLRAFRTVLEYLQLQEPDQYNAANADLMAQLELLAEMEQATVVNVL